MFKLNAIHKDDNLHGISYYVSVDTALHSYIQYSLNRSKRSLIKIVNEIMENYIQYRKNYKKIHKVVPQMLEIYEKYLSIERDVKTSSQTMTEKEIFWNALQGLKQEIKAVAETIPLLMGRKDEACAKMQLTLDKLINFSTNLGINELVFFQTWTVSRFEDFLSKVLHKMELELSIEKALEVRILQDFSELELYDLRRIWNSLVQLQKLDKLKKIFQGFYAEIATDIESTNKS